MGDEIKKAGTEDPRERYRHILRNLAPVCQAMSYYGGPDISGACDDSIKRLESACISLRRLENDIRRNFKDQA